ncbi:TIGR04053 family radical SAM/SPASM domain-containing protein [Corynebacterium sp. SCR221107]|uniref:TIGR04053 family radical SAM/SPASM domain-containing protein n=1 Tax=Corynebacterium sp. SCR221107 TaxID=3017361 RepID=UPI0022EC35CA|nr:TIGR04053 family radical SAM/SPASM domain-containing protein [Corynebacterium sp. SCR221107]WBT09708.1 TIGR04053 family radical SAM/SPASM domain-containing protein [Corynebacterium sp. SCR221107]
MAEAVTQHVPQAQHLHLERHREHPDVRKVRHDLGEKPFLAIWEVTRACQLVCKHCRADSQHHAAPGQLTTEEGKRLLDQLASYDLPRPIVVFSGGDPFERTDLEELTEYGTSLGLHIGLSPSATPKVTLERLQRLHELGATALSLSLDGAVAETHDAFRGFPGTFDATLEKARFATDTGFRLQVNSTLCAENIREAPALLKRVMGMNAHLWSVFFLVPTGRGTALTPLTAVQREDVYHWMDDISSYIAVKTTEAPAYRRVVIQAHRDRDQGKPPYKGGELYRFLTEETARVLGDGPKPQRRPRPPLAINSGRGFVFIDHIGDVYPSGFFPMHLGNVKDTPLPVIYSESEVFKSLREPAKWKGKCSVCEFNDVCGGSRSTAYAMTGDPFASDPTCGYVPASLRD